MLKTGIRPRYFIIQLFSILVFVSITSFGQSSVNTNKDCKTKDYACQINEITNLIQANPDKAEHYKNRGDVYYADEKFTKAIADYTKAIEIDDSFVEAYLGRSRSHSKRENGALALIDAEKALEIRAAKYYGVLFSWQCIF